MEQAPMTTRNRRNIRRNALRASTFLCAMLISLLAPALLRAQASDREDGMRFIPDVAGQFRALTERADSLGFHISTTPDPSTCKHYQAIARVDGADGTPFFLVTRSGNTPQITPIGGVGGIVCDDSPGEKGNGNLIIFRMDSRDKHGERIRSNRLRKGVHVNSTAPDPLDEASIFFSFTGGNPGDPDPAKRPGLVFRDGENNLPPRGYQHPGGMQLVGNILAVALETPRFLLKCLVEEPEFCATDPTLIQFYDVSDPENPVFVSQFVPVHEDLTPLTKAGVVAVTPLNDGRNLMAVTGGDGETLFFYKSSVGPLSSESLTWEWMGESEGPDINNDIGRAAHQTLQFLREGNIEGPLYLAGSRGSPIFGDRDRIDLYLVNCETPLCEVGEEVSLTVRYKSQRITPHPNTGGTRLVNLAAAAGFHVTPSGELLFYATEHDNDGPDGTVKAGEWRHREMSREDSPTRLPTARVNGPFVVDEGSSVSLSGSAAPAIEKAWIQLYHEPEFESLSIVVDYDDYDFDDFDNFAALEFLPVLFTVTQNDKAQSWRWFAPPGCSIIATDLHNGNIDEVRTLTGDGLVHRDPFLSQVMNDGGTDDINAEIDLVRFDTNCANYYATPVGLRWDLDGNSSYETAGNVVVFSAAAFDGPSQVAVPVQAQHPAGGPAGFATAQVSVRNVAPQLSGLTITDGGGNQVNAVVPFVLLGSPVTVAATFTDPGLLDTQTASISWGDGVVEGETAFTSFDDAFGDGTGSASHVHAHSAAGSFSIMLTVTDDDGGVDTEAATVLVLTPEQAVKQLIEMIDDAIAGTTNPRVRDDLEKARKALAGSNAESNNGALNMIRNGNDAAAAALLDQAIKWLERAVAEGADVATLIALIEQVQAAL